MGKRDNGKKTAKKNHGKENDAPGLLSSRLIDNLLDDKIADVVGRRSDVGRRSVLVVDSDDPITDVDFNDDEQEKEELRREGQERSEREKAAATRDRGPGLQLLGSLTQEELDQHYSKCIEMCNKNKVNVKNAFKLQLIDYMKMIIASHSTKSENLTLMSCTLGASAKIYSVRVDKVYTDMVKLLSGKGTEIEKDDSDNEGTANEEDEEGKEAVRSRKKKNSNSSDEEEDKKDVDLESMLLTEAQLNKSNKGGDAEPPERPTLPKGLEYFLECRQLDPGGRLSLNPPVFPDKNVEFEKPSVDSFVEGPSHSGKFERLDPNDYIVDYKKICKCFAILGLEDKEESVDMNSSLAFDPSCNIPDSIRLEADERELDLDDGVAADAWAPPDYDEDEVPPVPDIGTYSMKPGKISSTVQPKSFSSETMAKLVSVNSGDYSFFDNSRIDFWSGPRHWTLKRPKDGDKVQRLGEQPKKTAKKTCYINFSSEQVKSIQKHVYTDRVNALLAKKTFMTWASRRCTIPQDLSYNQKQLLSLMKNDRLMYVKKDTSTNMISNIDLKNVEDETVLTPDDFGVEIDHDADDDDNHFDGDLAEPLCGSSPPLAEQLPLEQPPQQNDSNVELIPAPQKVEKISIKFAKAQKRLDIKLLKTVMWDCLGFDEDKKKSVKFSEVYSALPSRLPKEEASQLSFPIAYMALLHMANERNLCIVSIEEESDALVTLD